MILDDSLPAAVRRGWTLDPVNVTTMRILANEDSRTEWWRDPEPVLSEAATILSEAGWAMPPADWHLGAEPSFAIPWTAAGDRVRNALSRLRNTPTAFRIVMPAQNALRDMLLRVVGTPDLAFTAHRVIPWIERFDEQTPDGFLDPTLHVEIPWVFFCGKPVTLQDFDAAVGTLSAHGLIGPSSFPARLQLTDDGHRVMEEFGGSVQRFFDGNPVEQQRQEGTGHVVNQYSSSGDMIIGNAGTQTGGTIAQNVAKTSQPITSDAQMLAELVKLLKAHDGDDYDEEIGELAKLRKSAEVAPLTEEHKSRVAALWDKISGPVSQVSTSVATAIGDYMAKKIIGEA